MPPPADAQADVDGLAEPPPPAEPPRWLARLAVWANGEFDPREADDWDRRAWCAQAIRGGLELRYWYQQGESEARTTLRDAENSMASFLMIHTEGAFATGAVRRVFYHLLVEGPAALRAAVADFVETYGRQESADATREPNLVTYLGQLFSRAIRRRVLITELRARGWNLARTARALGMGAGASPVLRMLEELGLDAEYERARRLGLIRRGRH